MKHADLKNSSTVAILLMTKVELPLEKIFITLILA
jgi:hypothetical protein